MSSFTTKEEKKNSILVQDCWEAAWEFGTGFGSDYSDWYWTNWFAEAFCDENGGYNELYEGVE